MSNQNIHYDVVGTLLWMFFVPYIIWTIFEEELNGRT